MAKEHYRESISYLTSAYKTAATTERQEEAAASIGTAYDFLNDREQATSWYRKAGSQPEVQRSLNRSPTPQEQIAEKIAWAYSIGLYSRVVSLADSAIVGKHLPDTQTLTQVLYQQGVACYESGLYDRADKCFTTVLSTQGAEVWLHPYSHYRLGMSLVKQDKTAAAKQQFAKVLEFEDYPSEDILRKRVAREKSALERNGK
jgi:tetratricopeptide (TPR) repeat protein